MADNVISKIKLPDNQEYILKDSNAARSDHTHDIALEKDTSGTNQLTLAAGTKYKLTAGGESYIFTTPADANNKVTIAADTTTNANYPLVFGSTNTSTTTAKTEGLQKSTTKFYVNPSTGNIQATTFNGIALTAAAGKSITDNSSNADVTSSDTNLITGRTLYYQLAKKGYTTNTGTVTNVATGAGLTGGPIATTGTIKANLTSETKLTNAAADGAETAGRVYPVRLDKDGKLAVNVPWTNVNGSYLTSITTTGNGNAITAVEKSGQSITFTKGSTFLTSVPNSFLKWQTTTSASTDLYDFGVYVNQNNAASSSMNGGNYFSILNIPYRKASGNTKADWGWQIGNTTSNDGRLWYRTSGDNVWGDWQTIAHATQSTSNIGSTTQPVYMTAAGVITAGTPLKNLAYKDSLSAADIPELAASKITSGTFDTARIPNLTWSKITSGKPTILSGYGITDAKIDGGVITLGSNTITPVTSVNGHTGNVVNVTAGDLGLSSALRYVGKTTSTMSESFTGVPAGISGYTKPIVGDVVLDSAGNGEYVCVGVSGTTYTWESLGSESSFKKVQTAVSSPSAGDSAQIEFIDTISQDVQGVISATKQPIRIASKTQTGVIQITKDNTNLFLNTLDTGSSTPTDNDYYISQYVGGGTTTTTYHRRPVSALYSYIKSKTDTLYPTKAGGGATGTWGISISGNAATATTATKFASAQNITLTGDTTGTKSSQAGWSIPTITSKMSGLGRKGTAESIAINQTTDIGLRLAWNIYDSSSRNADAENTPSFDASVINIPWDWGAYNGQIAISSTSNVAPRMQIRTANHKDNGSEANPRYTPLYTTWREIVTAPKDSAVGGATQPVYINNTGQVVPGTALGTAAYKATGDFATSGHNHDSTYLKLSGGTLTGAINTANGTWNKIGDDIQIGDINKAGHLGIKGVNGNTGIFFTTYGQPANATGGAITWDGTKFSISSTTPINATVASAASLTSSAAPTITKTGTSTIDLTANTTYTLTVGGQSVIFKTPADDNSHYTTHLYAGGSSATGNAEVTSGNVYIRLFDNTTHRNSIQLSPGSNMSITSNDEGVITFTSIDKSHKSGSWNGLKYTATAIGGADELSFTLPTGTGATQVALGNHNHDSVYVKKADGVTAVTWDATNKKLTRTINGTAADVMTAAQMSTALGLGTIASKTENSYMKFGGDDTNLGNGSPADTAKTYWADTTKVSDNMITGYYNHSGTEYSLLFSKRSTYGSILKWGYGDKYLRILRIQSGTWKSTDWEKIDAGYADSAGIANKLGTADKGSGTKPIYLAAGVPTECSTYAGGTAVTLNGASKAASTASFYAPTSAGNNTQALVGGTPTWTNISPSISIGAGTASAAPTVNVSVLGQSGTAQSITTANTAVYGVTKLQDGVSSDSTVLAATAKAAKTASTSATHTLATTTKFFVTGCTSSTTNTAGDDFDTGVYVTTTAGEFSAVRHSYNVAGVERAYTHYNMTDQSIDFVFV